MMPPTERRALAALLCLLVALVAPAAGQATNTAGLSTTDSNKPAKNFTLPALPYDYAALEPFIDAETMRVSYIWRWSV
jgi:hypothetical protein